MIRGLTLAVALALGTVTIPVHALGLGDIKPFSALNQEFNADIDLLSVAAGELDAVRVNLATQDEFDKAGVERPFYLTLLKFTPTERPDGNTVVRVSSDFPIREPFLNFLIEVNWPRGRLIREYTVLLDPPATTGRRAPAVATAPVRTPTTRVAPAPRVQAPVVAGPSEYGPVAAKETLWSIASKLRPQGASMAQTMIALREANPAAFIDGDINRLRKGVILRVPARDEVLSRSRQQAQAAYTGAQDAALARQARQLQAAPVQAESKPEPAQAPQAEAVIADPVAAAEPDPELRIATARPQGEGEAGASEDRGDAEVGQLKEKLLLARENAESSRLESESLKSEITEMQERLADMQRLLSLKDEQLARLQANVAGAALDEGAEPVYAEPPEAVEEAAVDEEATPPVTGDESLVAGEEMETPVAEDVASEELPAGIDPEVLMGLKPAPEAVTPAEAVTGLEEEPVFDETEILFGDDGGIETPVSETEGLAELPELSGELDPLLEEPVIQPETAPEVAMPEAAPVTPEIAADATQEAPASAEADPSAFDWQALLADRNVQYAAGGGVLLLLLLLLLWKRRKGSREEPVLEPLAPEEAPDVIQETGSLSTAAGLAAASGAAAGIAAGGGVDGETDEPARVATVADHTDDGLDAVSAEVDAVAEADVYIAYGRYKQAEELLQDALEREPGQPDLNNKLLEVYYATRNKDQFNQLAAQMQESGQDQADPQEWHRICDMGRELDADNPRYSGAQEPAAAPLDTDVDAEGVDASVLDDIVDSTLNDIEAEEKLLADSVDEPLLDIEDLEEIENLEEISDESLSLDELESLDLDLPPQSGAANRGTGAAAPDLDDSLETLELPSLDMDSGPASETGGLDDGLLGFELEEMSDLDSSEIDLKDSADDLDADLGGLASVTTLEQADGDTEGDADLILQDLEDDLGGLDAGGSGLDQPISLDDAFDSDLDSDVEVLDADTLDEGAGDAGAVGTKLELAQAFVEMGDGEGARDILAEVVKEGNEHQRQEAEELLQQIG